MGRVLIVYFFYFVIVVFYMWFCLCFEISERALVWGPERMKFFGGDGGKGEKSRVPEVVWLRKAKLKVETL